MRGVSSVIGVAALLLVPASSPPALAGDEANLKVIPAAEAKDHVGERCTVELTVRASKNSTHRRMYYLDSESDFRDPKNFAAVITYEHAEKFEKVGIDDPAVHYRDKTIRVTGKVVSEADQVRIRVTEPSQVRILDPKSP